MMNFVEQEKDEQEQEEEEEEEEEELVMTNNNSKLNFPSPSSPSSSSTKYRNFLPQHHNLWLGPSESHQDCKNNHEPSLNFDGKLELMDLSLGNDNGTINTGVGGGSDESTEREHMFDKVVTPSDVGKLNRLVIPKQHAEKYFPLDSSSNEKGLLLNFEDRNGKPWRFRYSYWNSSQSYVMTKGWSHFVKDKKLDAGDIVSFQRGVGESGKHRLYIDWRHRPNAPDPTSFKHLELQNQLHFPQSVRWGRLYSLPQPLSSIPGPYDHQHHHHQFGQQHHLNYTSVNHQPYYHHHHHYHHHNYGQYYLRPPAGGLQIGAVHQQYHYDHQRGSGDQAAAPMVIDSVPVVHGRSVGKRLRLFGVNMECPIQDHDQSLSSSTASSSVAIPQFGTGNNSCSSTIVGSFAPHLAASSTVLTHPQSRVLASSSSSGTTTVAQMPAAQAHEFSKKGKTSLSFDLDL